MHLRTLIHKLSWLLVFAVVVTAVPGSGTAAAELAAAVDPTSLSGNGVQDALPAPLGLVDSAESNAADRQSRSRAAVPALETVEPPLLSIFAEPTQVTLGEVVTYSVAITNVATVPLREIALNSALPSGMVYVPDSADRLRLVAARAAPVLERGRGRARAGTGGVLSTAGDRVGVRRDSHGNGDGYHS